MIALFRSELLKLRTTRTAIALAVALLVITTMAVVGPLLLSDALNQSLQQDLVFAATFSVLFSLLFGTLVMTGEFRHGTATPTFLVAPKREQVIYAKALAAATGGLMLALAALVLVYAVSIPWLLIGDHEIFLFDGKPVRAALATVSAAAIWGALGVGLGAVVRSQVGAIVGGLVWFLILEGLVGAIWDDAAPYLPGAAIGALAGDSADLSSWAGAVVSLAYATVFCVAGILLTARRDIT